MQLFTSDCSSLSGLVLNNYGNGVTPTTVTKDSRSAWHCTIGTPTSGYDGSDVGKQGMQMSGIVEIIATFRCDVHQTISGAITLTNFTGEPYIDSVRRSEVGIAMNWMFDGVYAHEGTNASGSFTKLCDTTNTAGNWETWKIVVDWNNLFYDLYRSVDGGVTYTLEAKNCTAFKTEPSSVPFDRVNFGCDSANTYDTEVWFDSVEVNSSTKPLAETKIFRSSNLVAYYPLNDVNDDKGSRHLTNNNSVGFTATKLGSSADFGSANTNKSLTYTTDNYGIDGGSVTLSCWVQLLTEVAGGTIYNFISLASANTDVSYDIGYNQYLGTYYLAFGRWKNNVANQVAEEAFSGLGIQSLHHMILTYDGTNVKGYRNGILIGTTAASGNGTNTVNSGLYIGRRWDNQRYASCIISDVGVLNAALSEEDCHYLFRGSFAKKVATRDFGDIKKIGGVSIETIKKNTNLF